MSHLDEGTLHALLDGELDLHEVKEIQAHIGSCASCGTRLREVKEFHGESDRLVGLMEMPGEPSRRVGWRRAPVGLWRSPAAPRSAAAPPNQPRISGSVTEPPPLLLPENPEYGSGRWMRKMRWAALILVTVGAGYLGTQMRQPSIVDITSMPADASLSDSFAGPVVSAEEATPANQTDSGTRQGQRQAGAGQARRRRPKRAAPPQDDLPPRASARRVPAAPEPKTANEDRRFSQQEAAWPNTLAASADESSGEAGAEPPPQLRSEVRAEAARALRELDRERQVDRADAATAALDSARRREAQLRQAASAPAPGAPDAGTARADLSPHRPRRGVEATGPPGACHGRDEPAVHGPGLGRVSPGADPTRPVVRVVYQDSQGRLILLDQQRVRPGAATSCPGNEPHWLAGEISLHLSGEVSADVLRNLRGRVR